MRTTEVIVDGVRSPVLEAGAEGAEEAVVFVHGNPGCGADWTRLLGASGTFSRSIALDMPGFGTADKPRDFPYTVDGYARHLAGALDQLGVRQVHLVLHDFGGPWGLQWAIDHPEAHRSTTLIDTGAFVGQGWHALAKAWRTPVLGELFFAITNRRGFRQLMRRTNPPTLPDAYIDHLFDLYDQGTKRAVLKLYRSTPVERLQAMVAPLRAQPRPTLVVWGGRDPYLKVAMAERQREVFGDVHDVVVLDGSGHWPVADDPDGVEAAVIPFLRARLDAPASAPTPSG